MTVRVFGYLIVISIDSYDFIWLRFLIYSLPVATRFLKVWMNVNHGHVCCQQATLAWLRGFRVKVANRPRSIYQYNILAWLRGFRVKIANFTSLFCPSIPKRDLDTKKTPPNIEV